LPFFKINGIFEEIDIPREFYVTDRIAKFEKPPIGESKDEDFDPTVHLEVME
jgi:hypothetical protein